MTTTDLPKKIVLTKPPKTKKIQKNNDLPLVNSLSNDIINNSDFIQPIAKEASIRLTKLPLHDEDFATKWYYANQSEVVADKIVIEFNIYNQVLEELEQEKIKLPDNFNAKTISRDLKTFILQDLNKNGVLLNTTNNLIHRAFYSHCVKRAIDSIRQGEFTSPDGYKSKRPEIADILQERINELLFEQLVKKKEN